jgi:predicted SAM-dependent methyltransferase
MTEVLLNLGSGPFAQAGWQNLDRSPSMSLSRMRALRWGLRRARLISASHMVDWSPEVIRADLRHGLKYDNEVVAAIYSSHALEHLYFADAQKLLGECNRVLRSTGVIRLALPDFSLIANSLSPLGAVSGMELQERLNAHPLERPRGGKRLQGLLSASYHRWQPTRDLVESMLVAAGFHDITFPRFREGRLPDLAGIETREESMFAEAYKQ